MRPGSLADIPRPMAPSFVRVADAGRLLLAVRQTEVAPGPSRVFFFEGPGAHREVRALQPFAAADVDDVGIGWGDRERADRAGRLAVEQRRPGAPIIRGPPYAAVVDADVEEVGLTRHARPRHRATTAKRADRPPVELVEERRVVLLGLCDRRQDGDEPERRYQAR